MTFTTLWKYVPYQVCQTVAHPHHHRTCISYTVNFELPHTIAHCSAHRVLFRPTYPNATSDECLPCHEECLMSCTGPVRSQYMRVVTHWSMHETRLLLGLLCVCACIQGVCSTDAWPALIVQSKPKTGKMLISVPYCPSRCTVHTCVVVWMKWQAELVESRRLNSGRNKTCDMKLLKVRVLNRCFAIECCTCMWQWRWGASVDDVVQSTRNVTRRVRIVHCVHFLACIRTVCFRMFKMSLAWRSRRLCSRMLCQHI